MKRFLITLAYITIVTIVNAQDRIVLKNTEEINARIENVSPDTVTYKLWDNINGPTYTIYKSDILFISYQNGLKESYADIQQTGRLKGVNRTDKSIIKFQGYANLGLITDFMGAGPIADVSVGAAITDHFYAGFETGFHSLITTTNYGNVPIFWFEGYIPLALNMKGYFTKTKARPFINISLGGFVGVADLSGLNGFYFQTGAGVDIKRFSIGLGYSGLYKLGLASNLYFNLGVRFGGKKYW